MSDNAFIGARVVRPGDPGRVGTVRDIVRRKGGHRVLRVQWDGVVQVEDIPVGTLVSFHDGRTPM